MNQGLTNSWSTLTPQPSGLTNSWPTLMPLSRGPNMWRLLNLTMSISPYFPKLNNLCSQEPIKTACLCGCFMIPLWVVFRSKTPCSYDPLAVCIPVLLLLGFVFLIVHSYLQFELYSVEFNYLMMLVLGKFTF